MSECSCEDESCVDFYLSRQCRGLCLRLCALISVLYQIGGVCAGLGISRVWIYLLSVSCIVCWLYMCEYFVSGICFNVGDGTLFKGRPLILPSNWNIFEFKFKVSNSRLSRQYLLPFKIIPFCAVELEGYAHNFVGSLASRWSISWQQFLPFEIIPLWMQVVGFWCILSYSWINGSGLLTWGFHGGMSCMLSPIYSASILQKPALGLKLLDEP